MLITEIIIESDATHTEIPELFHISFDDSLEGMWDPELPAGSDTGRRTDTSEPDIPRISCAPTLKQCFQAIYPNISKYFEEKNYPHMTFYVYQPELTGNERVLTPDDLIEKHYVHDAHLTGEYCILDPVYMKKTMEIKIANTNDSEFMYYHPFNDQTSEKQGFAPKDVKIKIIKHYNS